MSIICPDCTTLNPSDRRRCDVCFRHLHDPEWRCSDSNCLYLSPVSSKKCQKCGKERTGQEKRPKSADRTGRPKDDKGGAIKKDLLRVGPDADKHKRSRSSDARAGSSRWDCCVCTFMNNADARKCQICDHPRGICCDTVTRNKWACHSCQNFNLEQFTRCCYCSKKRRTDGMTEKKDKQKDKTGGTDQDKKTKPKSANKKSHDQDGGGSTANDWLCKRCSFKNDNSKRDCGRCQHNKPRVTGFDLGDKRKVTTRRHDLRRSIKAKDLRTIKTRQVEKEWRNIVLSCQQTNTNFVDTSFPPDYRSLYRNPKPGGSHLNWLRLKDVMDEKGKGPIQWKVYDKPTADDIVQGEIGNCWFICALAVVAERQKLLERIVVTQTYCPEGAYVVRLCKDGTWTTVVLDDYFPVDQHKRLKYSTARRGQLWVPLIEKAAAKIHGCYEALASGRTVESLSLLTGEPCEHLSLTENKDLSKTLDSTLVWSKLTNAKESGYLMCTSCEAKDGFTTEYCKSMGLITGHAYSLLDIHDLDTGEKLIRVRNPWGKESWKGDWSDNSPKWKTVKPDVKRKLKPDENKNGIFWMEFNQFRMHFRDVDICKVRDWHETRVKGSFPASADGPWKFVKVFVRRQTDLCLGIHQRNRRGKSSTNEDFVDMMIVVFEILKDGKMKTVEHSKRDTKSFVGCQIERLRSGDYIVACLALKHLNGGGSTSQHQRDFVLALHSTENILVEENDSVNAGFTHYLADTLLQLAIDKGKYQGLKYNVSSYGLSTDGWIYVVENRDKKNHVGFQQDCSKSKNLISTRGSAFTQDIIPPGYRQVIIAMSTKDSGKGYSMQQSMTYISDNRQTLEYFGDNTRKHKPDIPKHLECLHIPRPIF